MYEKRTCMYSNTKAINNHEFIEVRNVLTFYIILFLLISLIYYIFFLSRLSSYSQILADSRKRIVSDVFLIFHTKIKKL